jgi:hypothetical protein
VIGSKVHEECIIHVLLRAEGYVGGGIVAVTLKFLQWKIAFKRSIDHYQLSGLDVWFKEC